MRMQEAGLIDQWDREMRPNIHQCADGLSGFKMVDEYTPLYLKSLYGIFLSSLGAYAVCILAFLGENRRTRVIYVS